MRKERLSMSSASLVLNRQSEQPSPAATALSAGPYGSVGSTLPGQAAFDLIVTRAGFEALEPDWNELFERAGRDIHLFQTFNWLWHWSNHFLPGPGAAGPRLTIVTARIRNRLVMVWPLVSERVGPITRLSWMGEPVSQYGDVLVDNVTDKAALLDAAWDFVTSHTNASVLQLRKVREDSEIACLLERKGVSVVAELKAPFLDLASAPSFSEYETRYSSGARRNRKRQRRRLEERGAITLQWFTKGAEAAALAAETFRSKFDWLRQRGIVSPALVDPRTAQFFADVTRADSRPAGCHVMALSSGEKPVAFEIGVRCKGRTAIHIIAYDLEFEKTAAGALLMEDSIRRAKDDGMTVYDLLAPGDGYKLEWADDAVIVRDWAMSLSALGRAYSTLYLGSKRALKRGLDALPVGARRKVTGVLSALISRGGKQA
jgi:CelD/BcsL family acetyltransferase involved in cellulose biosynthesis